MLKPTPLLGYEVMSGLLGPADHTSRGLFLVYQREPPHCYCHSFRLILAPSLAALRVYLDGRPRGVEVHTRVVNIRYPGQLAAAELYFNAKIERTPTQAAVRSRETLLC